MTFVGFASLACGGQTVTISGSDASRDGSVPDGSRPRDGGHVEASSTCGAPGQPCCPTEACAGGGCCVDAVCTAEGRDCGHGLGVCSSGGCGGCGAIGQPCCPERLTEACSGSAPNCWGCTQAGSQCSSNPAIAHQGDICVACGGDGQPCCYGGDDCTGDSLYCNPDDGRCTSHCGGPGEPCCGATASVTQAFCRNGGCCMSSFKGGSGSGTCAESPTCGCSAGKCTTCGTDKQACCEGDLCEFGIGLCFGGVCNGGDGGSP
jgi:hypothetical protein